MNVESELRAQRPREAMALLQDLVKRNPGDLQLRSRLFQVLCVLGQWERAQTQLRLLPELESAGGELMLAAPVYARLITCEIERQEVFAGRRTPVIFGEPSEWMGLLAEALRLQAGGKRAVAAPLRDQAFEAAPTRAGTLDGQPFEWIADADSRLGPMLEAVIAGKYFWVPFDRIQTIAVDPPSRLHDRVWLPAQFTWVNGDQIAGHLPVRYAGTESSEDGALLMAGAVAWEDQGHGFVCGRGQRMFVTDTADKPLLNVRRIEWTRPEG